MHLRISSDPVLYLGARGDRLIGLRGLRQVDTWAPSASFDVLDDPHMLLQAHPGQAARCILDFLDRL